MEDIKPFKSFKEQLDILKERGLIIDNEDKALKSLQYINYYRLSGYTLTLRKHDVFYKGITLANVLELYNFDSELRVLILYLLENIEVSFRTHIAYYHSQKYGSLGYLNCEGFENKEYHNEFINGFNSIINSSARNSDVFTKHHKSSYGNKFPFWVAVELLTFGNLSRLYSNFQFEIKQKIAIDNYGIRCEYIQNWLHGLVVLRNICAHRGRLYNRPLSIKPRLSNKDKKLGIKNNLVFVQIFIIKKLVNDNKVWDNFLTMLDNIIKRYPFVKLSYLGFPENWYDILKSE